MRPCSCRQGDAGFLCQCECGARFRSPHPNVFHVCAPPEVRPSSGPGTELKALLASFGIKATSGCKCNSMARQMDSWGPDESLKHIEEIVDVMQETAKSRKLPFLRLAGRKLVRVACNRARKKSAQTGQ